MFTRRTALGLTLCAASLAWSAQALADINCQFSVTNVGTDTSGDLVVGFGGTDWYLCNLSGSVSVNNGYGINTVTSAQCSGIFAQFLTARASGQPITLSFHGPANCAAASLPANGTWPNPYPTFFWF